MQVLRLPPSTFGEHQEINSRTDLLNFALSGLLNGAGDNISDASVSTSCLDTLHFFCAAVIGHCEPTASDEHAQLHYLPSPDSQQTVLSKIRLLHANEIVGCVLNNTLRVIHACFVR